MTITLALWIIYILMVATWVLAILRSRSKRKVERTALHTVPDLTPIDPYAPRCPFCMMPTVDEHCENLDCWFVGNIVPVPEFVKVKPKVTMPTFQPARTWKEASSEDYYGPGAPLRVDPRIEAAARIGVMTRLAAEHGVYIDMSMATPQMRELTPGVIAGLTMDEYAMVRDQLLEEARKSAKPLRSQP